HKFALQFYVENWEDSLLYNYENGEEYMPVQLTYNDTLVFENIGVRYKGNSSFVHSSNTPKKPFKFRFDKYVSNQLLCGVSKLNFSNCIKDPSFVREKIAYEIIGKYVPSPRTAYSEIYINDELIGLYVQVEQIDEYFLDRNFNESSGNLFKAHDDGSTMQYYGSEQTLYESEFDLKTNENANDWSDLVMLLDNLNNSSDEDFYSVMEQYLDFDSCARNLAFNMVLSHFDSYTGSGRNFYLYHENSSDRFLFLPWDLNESFGAYSNNWDVFTQDILNISNLSQRPLNKRFLENETLSELYKNYIVEMISGPAAYDSISVKAEELKAFIDPYVLADNNKLYSYQDFLDNIENDVFIGIGELVPGIKSFSEQRNAALETQLTTTQVFPGDTDNNGVVDELDILPIGVYFLTEGNPRNTQSFSWQSFQVQNWDNPAAAFADANGDGIINEIDVIGIGINWGNTHQNPAFSYEIDLNDTGFLKQYESNFSSIYHNLNGESEAEDRMKSLLESVFGFEEEDENNPVMFLQNSPNPFNQQTTIFYGISAENSENIEINIYNVKGQKVRQFSDINDRTSVIWDGKDENGKKVDSGVYFYAGKFKNVVIKSKMLLIKE
ncbi:MAG: CotH kinase family protein, partial [Candidatus Cloacimonetes bacterium]|nr:CotH kinase family protein [Candidatus Cloacimonadota bacterium]